MRRRITAGVAVVAMAALSVVAVADAAPRHHHRVSAQAARVTRLKARVAADLPNAEAQVNAAKAAGPAAVHQLVQQVASMPLAAPETTSPQQYALLQALNAAGETTETQDSGVTQDPPSTSTMARAASACWYVGSHIWSGYNFYEGGWNTAHFEKDHDFWCGNGYSITNLGGSNYGFYHKTWAQGPFCTVTVFNVNGWDGPHASWIHGGMIVHYGSYTPWTTCATWLSGTVGLRVAADGHWDRYFDF